MVYVNLYSIIGCGMPTYWRFEMKTKNIFCVFKHDDIEQIKYNRIHNYAFVKIKKWCV